MIFFTMQRGFIIRSYLQRGNGAKISRCKVYKGIQLASRSRSRPKIRFRVLGSVRGVFYADGIVNEGKKEKKKKKTGGIL